METANLADRGASLRVVRGPMAGTVFRLPEPSVVVGRAPDCAISISDSSISRRHFEVAWSGHAGRLADLGSRNGVFLNGKPVQEAVIRPGDEIRAGDVTLRLEGPPVALFQSTIASMSPMAPAPMQGTLLAALSLAIRSDPTSRLYALIDGAQAFELAFMGRLMGHELYTIFSGELADTIAHVGPCLVAIGEPSGFLAKWVERIGAHVGVLLESAADLETLYAHLRSIFGAIDENGQEYFFRFYDPRVLRAFLPTCRDNELQEFFGPVVRWIVEAEEGSAFMTCSLQAYHLSQKTIAAREEDPGN